MKQVKKSQQKHPSARKLHSLPTRGTLQHPFCQQVFGTTNKTESGRITKYLHITNEFFFLRFRCLKEKKYQPIYWIFKSSNIDISLKKHTIAVRLKSDRNSSVKSLVLTGM